MNTLPIAFSFLACALSLWPLMRLYQRVGLSRAWALLVFTSLLIPFLGFLLVLLPLAFKVWPNFPKSMPAPKPVKTPL